MGFMKNMFNKAQEEIGNSLKQSGTGGNSGGQPTGPTPTAWEKAVSMLDGIVTHVSKVDPDGKALPFFACSLSIMSLSLFL